MARKRNQAGNHPALGAFLGSSLGTIPGMLVRSTALSSIGSAVGGAVGGYYGASGKHRKGAALGGGVGGLLFPLGASIGAYIGGHSNGERNPSGTAWALGIAGAVAIAGGSYAAYRISQGKPVLGPAPEPGPTPPIPEPPVEPPAPPYVPTEPPEPPGPEGWGIPGMVASSQAMMEGVPVRLYQDDEGRWSFAYSWRGTGGEGPLWSWLKGQTEVHTVFVPMQAQNATEAFNAAAGYLSNLAEFVDIARSETDMQPGEVFTNVLAWSVSSPEEYGLGYNATAPIEGAPPGVVQTVTDDAAWGFLRREVASEQSGCCYTGLEVQDLIA